MGGEADERVCVYYLRESLHKVSQEVSALTRDMAANDKNREGTLHILKDYIRRISDEMTVLDNMVQDRRIQEE